MNNIEQNDTIDIKEEFGKYLRQWRLFALGAFLSLIIGGLYLRYATPIYKVDASIMIKDNKQAGISTELEGDVKTAKIEFNLVLKDIITIKNEVNDLEQKNSEIT